VRHQHPGAFPLRVLLAAQRLVAELDEDLIAETFVGDAMLGDVVCERLLRLGRQCGVVNEAQNLGDTTSVPSEKLSPTLTSLKTSSASLVSGVLVKKGREMGLFL
jgi:hypothetical protein